MKKEIQSNNCLWLGIFLFSFSFQTGIWAQNHSKNQKVKNLIERFEAPEINAAIIEPSNSSEQKINLESEFAKSWVYFETLGRPKCPHGDYYQNDFSYNDDRVLFSYTYEYYHILNKKVLTSMDFKIFLNIIKALHARPQFEGTIYRGGKLPLSLIEQIKNEGVGTVIKFPKFLSTSRYLRKAFSKGDRFLIVIKSHWHPAYIGDISVYKGEEEVLVPPYLSLKVLDYDFDHSYELSIPNSHISKFTLGKLVLEELVPDHFHRYNYNYLSSKETHSSLGIKYLAFPSDEDNEELEKLLERKLHKK